MGQGRRRREEWPGLGFSEPQHWELFQVGNLPPGPPSFFPSLFLFSAFPAAFLGPVCFTALSFFVYVLLSSLSLLLLFFPFSLLSRILCSFPSLSVGQLPLFSLPTPPPTTRGLRSGSLLWFYGSLPLSFAQYVSDLPFH